MKNFITTVVFIVALFSASFAFAIEASTYSTQSYAEFAAQKTTNAPAITAFQGINSSHISPAELNQVSGDGKVGIIIAGAKYGWKAGKWVVIQVASGAAVDAAIRAAKCVKNAVSNRQLSC